ncbi:MAG: ribulose-phosphate 3-epimerase [Candidatus Woesearchaeota archaeon]|jgi:ribulose-phosphate 3-epimerase|nr:ribulose-phosphate 3-epimerase [Candidatus Woesearchaeota archaeon]MDP6265993.1 ribulose-phosphate 3-epimerase [Candidatus Woesearchaeota archaeon]MDP7322556.1 ribulose-phosphate 3-epimerase [Candidatus Woesearchaeota archaeon]MDP7476619.1 ribulose-phosphate 3-epimerase [Candidatus Woesearchaeota archaeon]HJO02163.1 ribulose-phosphate 3-epimerase [Candidatus Woesearchaeota archaeon]|tara:strand:+ start:2143 stop:2805 length:663 start_codon:yes stop_codon:yes gene_type:complete
MPKIKIVPSILSANQDRLQEEINEIEDYSDLLQVDVMDNKFVPNITPQAELLKKFDTKVPLDIHLMVQEPSEKYIKTFINANKKLKINNITVHYEACSNLDKTLNFIKKNNIKAAVAINPKTSLDAIKDRLDDVDMVLVMTVEPGFSGQKFMESCMDKVKELRRLRPELDIQVDGGVNDETAAIAAKAGANVLVVSSFIFKSEDKVKAINSILDSIKQNI